VVVSGCWRASFPEAHVGVLTLRGVGNAARHPALDEALVALEVELRRRYRNAVRATLLALPTLQAYQPHYRAFGQTYHVLRQLESVVIRSRGIGGAGGTLVSAMFAAELSSQLLTAGHDLEAVAMPLTIDCSIAGDRFVTINGEERDVRAGDMVMRDAEGI